MAKRVACEGGCGSKTTSYKGLCAACVEKIRKGASRADADGILVDFAGGAAWAWDKIGNVIAGPAANKIPIWIALSNR